MDKGLLRNFAFTYNELVDEDDCASSVNLWSYKVKSNGYCEKQKHEALVKREGDLYYRVVDDVAFPNGDVRRYHRALPVKDLGAVTQMGATCVVWLDVDDYHAADALVIGYLKERREKLLNDLERIDKRIKVLEARE